MTEGKPLDDLLFMGACLATDEPQAETREGLRTLRAFDRTVMEAGLDDTNRVYTRAAGIEQIAEYAFPLAKMTVPVASVVIAWLHGRAGRRVKFRVCDVLIEARTREDVEALIAHVKKVRKPKPARVSAGRRTITDKS